MLVAVFGVTIHYDASSSRDAEKSNIRVEQKALLEGKKQYIEWVMSSIMRETALLADIVSAKRVYEITDLPQDEQRSEKLSRLRSILEAVSQRKEVYDQLRYIDMKGNEVVRINFDQHHSHVVPEIELQNKSHRYYF